MVEAPPGSGSGDGPRLRRRAPAPARATGIRRRATEDRPTGFRGQHGGSRGSSGSTRWLCSDVSMGELPQDGEKPVAEIERVYGLGEL
jgi:hypothetical protein